MLATLVFSIQYDLPCTTTCSTTVFQNKQRQDLVDLNLQRNSDFYHKSFKRYYNYTLSIGSTFLVYNTVLINLLCVEEEYIGPISTRVVSTLYITTTTMCCIVSIF